MGEKETIKEATRILKKDRPRYKQRAQHQMTLGSLIKALKRERTGLLVKITDKHYPSNTHSYFGQHTDLAFEPSEDPITVAELLKECESSIGKSFITADHFDEFYKDYVMQVSAPLWISTLGQASKKGIVDLVPTDGYIKLVTENIEKEITWKRKKLKNL